MQLNDMPGAVNRMPDRDYRYSHANISEVLENISQQQNINQF